jgi:hypothetical protein
MPKRELEKIKQKLFPANFHQFQMLQRRVTLFYAEWRKLLTHYRRISNRMENRWQEYATALDASRLYPWDYSLVRKHPANIRVSASNSQNGFSLKSPDDHTASWSSQQWLTGLGQIQT